MKVENSKTEIRIGCIRRRKSEDMWRISATGTKARAQDQDEPPEIIPIPLDTH